MKRLKVKRLFKQFNYYLNLTEVDQQVKRGVVLTEGNNSAKKTKQGCCK